MPRSQVPRVAIVDYGLGNLFSVKHACEYAGIDAFITSSKDEISAARGVILPGVGAFGDAVDSLKKMDLYYFLIDIAQSDKPFVGICLGMQLLMEESFEFGRQQGLGVIKGSVLRFEEPKGSRSASFKVPQVGWNRIFPTNEANAPKWNDSLLKGTNDGDFMYFVHSFYVKPKNSAIELSRTAYENIEFCSSFQHKNIFACQFHPERSGVAGLNIYRNLKEMICLEK